MKKIFFVIAGVIALLNITDAFSQARLVFNNNAYLKMKGIMSKNGLTLFI